MKRLFTLALVLFIVMTGFAQADTTRKNEPDTIKVGGMIIIRNHGDKNETNEENLPTPKKYIYHYSNTSHTGISTRKTLPLLLEKERIMSKDSSNLTQMDDDSAPKKKYND